MTAAFYIGGSLTLCILALGIVKLFSPGAIGINITPNGVRAPSGKLSNITRKDS